MIKIGQGGVIHSIDFSLDFCTLLGDVEEVRRIEASAYDERVSDLSAKVAEKGGSVEKIGIGEALFEGAVDEDVVLVGLRGMEGRDIFERLS